MKQWAPTKADTDWNPQTDADRKKHRVQFRHTLFGHSGQTLEKKFWTNSGTHHLKPSGKTQARKKHRVRIRQTRSSLLRQTFADKKSGQRRQESEETFQTEVGRESAGWAQTDYNWFVQTNTVERNIRYRFRQVKANKLNWKKTSLGRAYWYLRKTEHH